MSIALLASVQCAAQRVITLPIKTLQGPNGFVLGKDGRLYIANEPGKKVIVVESDSLVTNTIPCDSPDGLVLNAKGDLYISNFHSGTIDVYRGGQLTTFVTGLSQPADIKLDNHGNLFVSEYDKHQVKKIDSKRVVTVIATNITNPFGLAIDENDNLYVGSNATGEIFKIANGKKSLVAKLPGAVAYLTYSRKTGSLYVACFTCHKVYKILANGASFVLAGKDQPGYRDGGMGDAMFEGPNSIALSTTGDLYISEFTKNRVRKIVGVE